MDFILRKNFYSKIFKFLSKLKKKSQTQKNSCPAYNPSERFLKYIDTFCLLLNGLSTFSAMSQIFLTTLTICGSDGTSLIGVFLSSEVWVPLIYIIHIVYNKLAPDIPNRNQKGKYALWHWYSSTKINFMKQKSKMMDHQKYRFAQSYHIHI